MNLYGPGVLFVGIGFFVGFEYETVDKLLSGDLSPSGIIEALCAIFGYLFITLIMFAFGEVFGEQWAKKDGESKAIRYLKTIFACVVWGLVVYIIVDKVH